ncbi:MAG: hypothetical protein EG826_02535 [Deltaproteobacteria bacterium]|nr:hypothetical protein [Deltaproteobacteria bacterium]
MPIRSAEHKTVPKIPCALLWDEAFLWGLMAWRALLETGLPFDLIRAEDIRAGRLSRYAMLLVPGGWAAAKLDALGEKGQAEIRSFVAKGGSYLGICGGAGMATESGLALLGVHRVPTKDRVPSFSGPIGLVMADHAIWKGIRTPVFHVWWPLQFQIAAKTRLRILARYAEASDDAYSADVRVGDGRMTGWPELEERYEIRLDPDRLKDEPAVVEGRYQKGKVLLSLVHFDTPGDQNGALVLRNLWGYLIRDNDFHFRSGPAPARTRVSAADYRQLKKILDDINGAVAGLIAAGKQKHLWQRRNPLLLQWRRGVRGMECSTLAAMIGEITKCLAPDGQARLPESTDPSHLRQDLSLIRELTVPFTEDARMLLALENQFATKLSSPAEETVEKMSSLKLTLFGSSRSYGGNFKRLIDAVDDLLFKLIK